MYHVGPRQWPLAAQFHKEVASFHHIKEIGDKKENSPCREWSFNRPTQLYQVYYKTQQKLGLVLTLFT